MRQRWHPWRRRYDLFMGRRQFAAIDGPFLAWEFELKDAAGNTLALIDRRAHTLGMCGGWFGGWGGVKTGVLCASLFCAGSCLPDPERPLA